MVVPTWDTIKEQSNAVHQDAAETIALQGLAHLMSQPEQIAHFLAETGFSPDYVRANAASPEVLEAALSLLLHDEAALLAFSANAGIKPGDIERAGLTLANRGKRAIGPS